MSLNEPWLPTEPNLRPMPARVLRSGGCFYGCFWVIEARAKTPEEIPMTMVISMSSTVQGRNWLTNH